MVATGFGIAAHLPYLKKLIHDHHSHKTPIRRIHLIWQMDKLDVGIAAQELLNEALAEDKLDGDYILRISLYSESEDSYETSFGRRATLHRGKIPLRDVIAAELEERLPKSRTVISVSANGAFRDELMEVMRNVQNNNTDLMCTEYQP
ncbi:ferric-chelate reductase [Metarhizium brunneum]